MARLLLLLAAGLRCHRGAALAPTRAPTTSPPPTPHPPTPRPTLAENRSRNAAEIPVRAASFAAAALAAAGVVAATVWFRARPAPKLYSNALPTHRKGQASRLVAQVRRPRRRNTPPDAGSYFLRRRRRVFDFKHNVARWTSDGPAEPAEEDVSQRVLRHYYHRELSLEALSAPLSLGETSETLQRALTEATFAPYQKRVDAFQNAMDATRVSWEVSRVELRVRRRHCLEDAAKALQQLPAEKFREPWYVTFANESALDAGGPSREFFRLVSRDLALSGLFCVVRDESYALKADAVLSSVFGEGVHLTLKLAGRLCGKALLEGYHLEYLRLNPVLLKHIVAEPLALKDLALLDGDLAKGLDALLKMDPAEIPALCLTWSVSDDLDGVDDKWTRDLIPGGSEKSVCAKDARSFVAVRFLDAAFAKSADGLQSFLGGLYDVVQPEALMLLSARELELQLCGAPTIDVKAWKRATVYRGELDVQRGNPFAPLHPVAQYFWTEVEGWSDAKRALLLLWCTGSSRPPARGFDMLAGRDGRARAFTLTSAPLARAAYPRARTRASAPIARSITDCTTPWPTSAMRRRTTRRGRW